MADALVPLGTIYEGLWIDWSAGNSPGYRLTLGPAKSMFLTSALAALITLCGVHLWTFVRYALRQHANRLEAQAVTPHLDRQQDILENTDSALTTARLMLWLAFSRRNSKGKVSMRALVVGISALIYAVSFIAVAIVSSQTIVISNNGYSPVRLRNPNCGIWNATYDGIANYMNLSTTSDLKLFVQGQAKRALDVQLSLEYAQECYLANTTTRDVASTCRDLKKSAIGQTPPRWQSCPFANTQLCHDQSKTMVLDTGELDTYQDFGINAPAEDRLKYRRVTTCTVLNDTSYITGWDGTPSNISGPRPTSNEARAFFGPSRRQKTPWTYAYSNFASFYNNFTDRATNPYQIDVELAFGPANPQWTASDFKPISDFTDVLKSGDLSLMFLSYTGMYLEPVQHPWFSADIPHHFDQGLTFTRQRYAPNKAISTLSCIEQHEFCTPKLNCTGLLGIDQVQNINSFNNALTPTQNATFDRLIRAVQNSRIGYVVEYLSSTTTPLLASNSTFGGNSGTVIAPWLSSDQWKQELRYWHAIAMAQLQRTVVEWATGQIAADPQYLVRASSDQDIWFCEHLLVSSAFYTTFNTLGIAITSILAVLIILPSTFVEGFVTLMKKLFSKMVTCIRRHRPRICVMRQLKTKNTEAHSHSSSYDSGNTASQPMMMTPNHDSSASYKTSVSSRASSRAIPWAHNFATFQSGHLAPKKVFHIERHCLDRPYRDPGFSISLHSLEYLPEDSNQGAMAARRSNQQPQRILISHPTIVADQFCGVSSRGQPPNPYGNWI